MSGGTNCYRMLNVLCPMHVIIDGGGTIRFAGPTARKLLPQSTPLGLELLDVFEIKRPKAITSIEDLRAKAGMKLHLRLRNPPHRELKAVLMEGPVSGQMIVNLSFGISVVEAVQEYGLTAADFAATDLAIEMLYLVEAKSAAMDASRQLNLRLQGARVAAEEQAFTDTLTGLKNRRAMQHLLNRMIEKDAEFALMHLDLDFFKQVNDTLGHAAGDHVLQNVARIMLEETRDSDTVARVGGDEFVILLKGREKRAAIARIGQRIIERLQIPTMFNGKACRVAASIGVSLSCTCSGDDADRMLENADLALYASKRAGRSCLTFYSADMRHPAIPGHDTVVSPELPKSA